MHEQSACGGTSVNLAGFRAPRLRGTVPVCRAAEFRNKVVRLPQTASVKLAQEFSMSFHCKYAIRKGTRLHHFLGGRYPPGGAQPAITLQSGSVEAKTFRLSARFLSSACHATRQLLKGLTCLTCAGIDARKT